MPDLAKPFGDLGVQTAEMLETLVDRLEEGWRRGCPPGVEGLLAETTAALASVDRAVMLRELVLTDVEYRLRCGQPFGLKEYLDRFPELRGDGEALAALVEMAGVQPAPAGGARHADAGPSAAGSAPRVVLASLPCGLARSELWPERLGKFELRELIGSGSFGEVYRARDAQLARDVALKIPRRDRRWTDQDAECFLREARHAARLRHPGIVPVFESGKIDGVYYLACAFVPGGTLRSRLKGVPLPFRQAAEIVARVAEALDYAHREGVVHRDVKPANILFDADGRPCLADFGLAKSAAPDATLTVGGRTGTPAFMSPEQIAGDSRQVDARSDIYSLGVMLYELLTGQLPFLGRGRLLEVEVLNDEPRPPRRLDEHVPVDLESICLKAMTKEAAGRYASAGAMADDLRRYLAGEPVAARPLGRLRRATRWCRRRPALTGLAAALAAAVVAGFGGVALQWRRAETHLELSQRNVRQAHAALRQLNEIVAGAGRKGDPESRPLRRKLLERSVEYYREFLRQLPEDAALRADVAHALYEIAFAAFTAGDKERAHETLAESLPLWEQLAAKQGDDRETLYFLGKTYYMLGLLRKESAPLDTLRWYDQARIVREKLVRLFPDDDSLLHDLVEIEENLAGARFRSGDRDKGLEAVESAIERRRQLVERHPGHTEYGRRLADTQRAHASMLRELGRVEEAEASCHKAVSIAASEVAAGRGMPYSATSQAAALILLARILLDRGETPTARVACRQAVELLEPLAAKYPSLSKVRELQAEAETEMQKIDPARATASMGK